MLSSARRALLAFSRPEPRSRAAMPSDRALLGITVSGISRRGRALLERLPLGEERRAKLERVLVRTTRGAARVSNQAQVACLDSSLARFLLKGLFAKAPSPPLDEADAGVVHPSRPGAENKELDGARRHPRPSHDHRDSWGAPAADMARPLMPPMSIAECLRAEPSCRTEKGHRRCTALMAARTNGEIDAGAQPPLTGADVHELELVLARPNFAHCERRAAAMVLAWAGSRDPEGEGRRGQKRAIAMIERRIAFEGRRSDRRVLDLLMGPH